MLNGKEIFLKGICCHEESYDGGRTLSDDECRQILATAKWLADRGTDTYALQIYRKAPGIDTGLDPVTHDWPGVDVELTLKGMFKNFILRRN